MKIRTGFVSNSSSSSFIIGIGKVNDIDKLRTELKKNNISDDGFDLIIKTYGDLLEAMPYDVKLDKNGSYISTDSFDGTEVFLRTDILQNDEYIIIYNDLGPHDDSDFWDGDAYDYDIDLEFTEKQDIIIDIISGSGGLVSYGEIRTGAGRNG